MFLKIRFIIWLSVLMSFIYAIPVFAEADLESEKNESKSTNYWGIIIPYRTLEYDNQTYLGNDEINNLPINWDNSPKWGLIYSSKKGVEYSFIYSENTHSVEAINCNSSNYMVNIGYNEYIYEKGSIRCYVFIRTTLYNLLEINNTSSNGGLTEANFEGGWLNRDWSINSDHLNTDDDDDFFDAALYIIDMIIDISKNSSYGLCLEYQITPKISLSSRAYYSLLSCKSTRKGVLGTDDNSKLRLDFKGFCSEFGLLIRF